MGAGGIGSVARTHRANAFGSVASNRFASSVASARTAGGEHAAVHRTVITSAVSCKRKVVAVSTARQSSSTRAWLVGEPHRRGFVALGSALVGALVVLIFESTSTTTPVETAKPRFASATEMFEPEHICVPGGRCRGRARSFRELPSTKVLAATLTASAKDDFERGVRLMEEEEYDDAIGAFRSAYESSRDPRLLWIIADCDKQR